VLAKIKRIILDELAKPEKEYLDNLVGFNTSDNTGKNIGGKISIKDSDLNMEDLKADLEIEQEIK
jgi:hypothetical protein